MTMFDRNINGSAEPNLADHGSAIGEILHRNGVIRGFFVRHRWGHQGT